MDFFTYVEMLAFACCVLVYHLVPMLQLLAGLLAAAFAVRAAIAVTALLKPQPLRPQPALVRVGRR